MAEVNPVLLVHGFYRKQASFKKMSTYLTHLGWSVHSFDLTPNSATAGLEPLAVQIADYIDRHFEPNQLVDLIGFSMGGLVTRYYIQRLEGIKRVQRYINISAPNHGTLMAYSLPIAGVVQMRPGSSFLADLNGDVSETLAKLNLTVMWTPLDQMIVPPASSVMPVGKHLKLPVLFHAQMLRDSRVLAAVAEALTEPFGGFALH